MIRYLALTLIASAAFAQAPQPQLTTADKIAISTAEKTKSEAKKAYEDAQQTENQVVSEWKAAHPGWHLNPQNFSVEADAKPEVKPEPKK